MSDVDDSIMRKHAFALALLKQPGVPFAAACAVADSSEERLQIARDWPTDSEVLQAMVDLEEQALPTRNDVLQLSWDKLQMADGRDFAAILKTYSEIRGWDVKKNETVAAAQTNVFVLREANSDAEWERHAIDEQRALTTSGTAIEH